MKPLSLRFAIPDHPWVDSADGAAVRIAMTVAVAGEGNGRLVEVLAETEGYEDVAQVTLTERTGLLHANLAVGADVGSAVPLEANRDLSCPGVKLHGAGFILTKVEAVKLGLGRIAGLEHYIREYRNGKDLTATPRGVLVIDLFGLAAGDVRGRFPEVFQWVHDRVKPERDANNRATYRDNWWVFGEPRGNFRPALAGLPRYIATVETSKHRTFQFLDAGLLPDNKLIAIALDDAFHLGVLSSRIHGVYALAAGSWLGVGNDPRYNKTRCFETFPFPEATAAQCARIRDLAERLDAHRKRQQALHPQLTLTDCYNVLEKLRAAGPGHLPASGGAAGLRAGDAGSRRREEVDLLARRVPPPHVGGYELTAKERRIHEQGLISVLRQLHDDLDAAVAEAYGLPVTASDDAILTHLCALNAQRAAEERAGKIRWLRPEFQSGKSEGGSRKTQATLGLPEAPNPPSPIRNPPSKAPWPKTLATQVQAVEAALLAASGPVTPPALAKSFTRAPVAAVTEILDTLATLGRARRGDAGTYTR